MATEPITINLEPEAAQIYKVASPDLRRKLDLLISRQLVAAMRNPRPLNEIMDEVGMQAEERGITPEILEEILRGE